MAERLRTAKKVLFITYLIGLHAVVLYFTGERLMTKYVYTTELRTSAVSDPTKVEEIPTPLPVPSVLYNPNPEQANTNTIETAVTTLPARVLLIPVAGVKAEQLYDSYSDARSDNRVHDAIDIPAPVGSPVLAAADGEIVKLWDSKPGGITIYQLTTDRKFVLYYAHLQMRAADVAVGQTVRRGHTIGYVGDTGNAGAGNYHLHFSVAIVTDPKRYWEGTYINPFPLLRDQTELPSN